MTRGGPIEIPSLAGERVCLRALAESDSEGMFALWSEPGVCAHAGRAVDTSGKAVPLPAATRSDSDRILAYWLGRARAGDGLRWAVLLDGRFVGAVGFNRLGARFEYAYHLIPSAWGRGLAAEASRLALDWAFARGATEIAAHIEPANAASIRLAERLGFVRAGTDDAGVHRYVLTRGSTRT